MVKKAALAMATFTTLWEKSVLCYSMKENDMELLFSLIYMA
jgi:hypothetical protein